MPTIYPAAIDNSLTLPSVTDSASSINALSINRLRDAIIAIESQLGVKPAGIYATVRARLDAMEQMIQNGGGGGGGGSGVVFFGDLSGTNSTQTVIGIHNIPINNVAPIIGQTLIFDGARLTYGTNFANQNILTTGGIIGGPTQFGSVSTQFFNLTGKQVFNAISTVNVSDVEQAIVYYDQSSNKLKVSENGGPYVDIITEDILEQLVFNVKHFGAVGDGTTNDTSAIQSAIAAAVSAGGGTVYFPRGVYANTGLSINATVPIKLVGVGSRISGYAVFGASWSSFVSGSIIKCTSTVNDGLVMTGTNTFINLVMDDVLLLGPGSGTTVGLNFGTSNCKAICYNTTIVNFNYGLALNLSEDCTFYSLGTHGCNVGIYANGPASNDHHFYDWQAQFCAKAASLVDGAGLSFYGGLIQSDGYGFVFEPSAAAGNFDRTSISGMWFENNVNGNILFNNTHGNIQDVSISECRMGDSYGILFTGTTDGYVCGRLQLGPNLQAKLTNLVLPANAISTKIFGSIFNTLTNNGVNTMSVDPDMGVIMPYIATLIDYTVLQGDYVVAARTGVGSSITITLPVSPNVGRTIIIKDKDGFAATYNVIINGNGKNIDGFGTFTMATNYESIMLFYNGTGWNIL